MPRKNITGQKFGKLLAIKYTGEIQTRDLMVECLCDCGNVKTIASRHLRSDRTKSCGCISKLSNGLAARRFMFREYERTARRKNLKFLLNFDQFVEITSKNCFYCGIPPSHSAQARCAGKLNGDYLFNGIDRKNNNDGYTTINCLPCCRMCNSAKSDFMYESFISWIDRIVQFRK